MGQIPPDAMHATCNNQFARSFAHSEYQSCMYLNVRFVVMQYGTSFASLTCIFASVSHVSAGTRDDVNYFRENLELPVFAGQTTL